MSSLTYHVNNTILVGRNLPLLRKNERLRASYRSGVGQIFFLFIVFLLFCFNAYAAEIAGPEIKVQNNDMYVTAKLTLDEKYLKELSNGITKEFRFHIDLFRIWNMWPDEFILSRSSIRTLKSDPVKMEHMVTVRDDSTLIRKRFKTFESMLQWALSVEDLKIASTRDLEPGVYFVRVTVESKIRKLPPVIGYFMIFVPENEFKISKDSATLIIGSPK
jgi:hypothetical protein